MLVPRSKLVTPFFLYCFLATGIDVAPKLSAVCCLCQAQGKGAEPMDVEIKREAAFAGQRVKQKVVFALALCSVIPLLVLTYVIHGHLVPGFESAARGMTDVLAIPILVAFTGLLMAGGGYVVWDLASAVSRAASLVSMAQPTGATSGARSDEIGTLVTSFN